MKRVGVVLLACTLATAAMAEAWHAASQGLETRRRARLIGDFVAGMTDRYAMVEHRRLFDATPDLR